jgi:copper transport protein
MLPMLLLPQSVRAHAVLVEANPAAGSVLDESPAQVVLLFNERLERQFFSLEVRNDRGSVINREKAEMSEDQRQISLALPHLGRGVYTVSYRVLSADGHPVSGSYVFSVGEPIPANAPADGSPSISGHAHHHGDPYGAGFDARQTFILTARVWYYFSLLLAAGLVLWKNMLPASHAPGERLGASRLFFQRSLMLSWIAVIGFQIPVLVDGLDRNGMIDLFTSSIGIIWLIQLALVSGSFLILNRHRMSDWLWVLAVLIVEAMNGHAAAARQALASVAADFAHLAAAAVWVGGLYVIVFLYRKQKQERSEALRRFARAAWISMLVLVVSGAAVTLLFLPDLSYLTYTMWGKLLLAKVGLVAAVAVVAALIRWFIMPRRTERAGAWMAVDLSLAAAIVVIAGIFSYMSPLPANKPLHWHVMGAEAHMTAEITPNAPGVNKFRLKVWLPEGDGEPKKVQFLLHPDNGSGGSTGGSAGGLSRGSAPLQVPVVPLPDPDQPYDFPGFDRYDYEAEGPYLPYPGKWKLEIRVTDARDQEWVYEREIRVY